MKKIVFLIAVVVSLSTASDLIKFKDTSNGSWNDFRTLAAKEHKLIFIDAYTDWCVWCKVMDKETFSDSVVADFMNSHFVNVRYEMETGFGITMSAKYRVNAFPTFLIFSADGRLVYRIIGYHKSKEFLKVLQTALDSTNHENLAGVSNELNPGFPEFYTASFGKKEVRVRPDSTTVNSFLASSKNLYSEASYSVMFRFFSLLQPEYKKFIVEHYDTLQHLYGKSDVNNVLNSYLRGELTSAIKSDDEANLNNLIALSDKYFPNIAEESAMNYRIQFYIGTNQWVKFADEVDKGIAAKFIEENTTNSFAWTAYEQCNDKTVLTRAAGWMEKVVQQFPQYMFVDTYAALLYKNGDVKKAKDYAEKAIALGKEEKTDVKETEDLLQKIKTELQSTKQVKKSSKKK